MYEWHTGQAPMTGTPQMPGPSPPKRKKRPDQAILSHFRTGICFKVYQKAARLTARALEDFVQPRFKAPPLISISSSRFDRRTGGPFHLLIDDEKSR